MMDDPVVWALFDHRPAPSYYAGNVAILGDAAHASTPHQGAGAGQALEDAFILSNLLADPRIQSASDIPKAFKAYDATRRPRSQKVVTTSRAAGQIYGFEGPDGADVQKIGENLLQRQRWIWEENMDEQLQKAQDLLAECFPPPMEQRKAYL
jgi:salicylate hydroxylase